MEKDKGEKREPEEEEERQLKRQRREEAATGSQAMSRAEIPSRATESQAIENEPMMTDNEPNEKKPELDGDGDQIMDVNLSKHVKVINLDKVNYFSDRQAKKIQQDIVNKKFGATLYDENVVEQVIANAKASSDSRRAAMARARKTAQIAEISQARASLEFVSVQAKDTMMSYPVQCNCYECNVNVTVRSENGEDTKISRMRSSMRISSDDLKHEDIDVTREGVKARYAITPRMLLSKLKKRLIERGRIDQISCLPVMATECYWDDLSGKKLKPNLVKKAREEEMEEFNKHMVYKKVPLAKAWSSTGKKPIAVRWVDVNKGDEQDPNYRSRLVAKEIKKYSDWSLFAATPPWEAIKLLFSLAVTEGRGWKDTKEKGKKIEVSDVRRAYFYAKARRQVFV